MSCQDIDILCMRSKVASAVHKRFLVSVADVGSSVGHHFGPDFNLITRAKKYIRSMTGMKWIPIR